MARIVELGSLAVMALIVAVFGSPLLGTLHHFRIPALVLLGAATIPIAIGMRNAYQGDPDRVRVNVTKGVLYLAAVLLAFATVAYPTKWLIPSCIVAVIVALVFEGITIAAPGKA